MQTRHTVATWNGLDCAEKVRKNGESEVVSAGEADGHWVTILPEGWNVGDCVAHANNSAAGHVSTHE